MRLISAHIGGLGRLVDTKVNLDSKVIAIVGPNEAGKTTLLKALVHMNSNGSVAVSELSRDGDSDLDATIVTTRYMLDDEDLKLFANLDLKTAPHTVTFARTAKSGPVEIAIQPTPSRSPNGMLRASAQLRKISASKTLKKKIDPESRYGGSDGIDDFRKDLSGLSEIIDSALNDRGGNLASATQIAQSLLGAIPERTGSKRLRAALLNTIDWIDNPVDVSDIIDQLWEQAPSTLLFGNEDRSIQSAYTLDEAILQNTPAALQNLLTMAQLDLSALVTYVQTKDRARRETAIAQANSRMVELFTQAWKQSSLAVRFNIEGNRLEILLEDDEHRVSVFDERSAGLRSFIALVAFLSVHKSKSPPILLIDEAENHLHIDAQADLVDMFVRQDQAVKVIYTTHSPACLPPDLGTGIRSVVPVPDTESSEIKNSFWQSAAGFSPLMMAMGAAAAAFTPARFVVLGEGATEMILLPTLIRNATKQKSLPYQIAPGLSEAPKDLYPDLDLEGAKVAYTLDGDDGGKKLERDLVAAGVAENLIVRTTVAGTENFLKKEAYLEAVSALLADGNPGKTIPGPPTLARADQESWSKQVDAWIEKSKLKAPSKVAVATWLIENEKAIPSKTGKSGLVTLHRRLLEAFSMKVSKADS